MQVFISYSRADKGFATRLADDLRAKSIQVWLDLQNIPHGSNWDMEVQRGLDTSDTMVVLLTPTASASQNVTDEWNYFIEKKRRIIPLMVQPNDVPFRLSRRQRVDFTNKSYEDGLAELVQALNEPMVSAEPGRVADFSAKTLRMAWGESYQLWNGLRPVTVGDVIVTSTDIRLLAQGKLPAIIPLAAIVGAQIKARPWDSYLAVKFTDKIERPRDLVLMGIERKTRKTTQLEMLGYLQSATGKVLG